MAAPRLAPLAPYRAAFFLAVFTALCAAQAPCLEGREAVTRLDVLRDDRQCYLMCKGEPRTWRPMCSKCCPKWRGGEGGDVPRSHEEGGGDMETSTKAGDDTSPISQMPTEPSSAQPAGPVTETEVPTTTAASSSTASR